MKEGAEYPNEVPYILFTFHDVIWFLFEQTISVIFMSVDIWCKYIKTEE
jgi:hypothetical protein